MRECCTDHEGKPKRKYKTRADAEKMAQLRREDGVLVHVYRCEEGDGWHLTSRNNQPILPATVSATYLGRKQKAKTHLGDLIDKDLADKMKNAALVNLEIKIEDIQEKIEQQTELYKKYKTEMYEIRNKLKEKEKELREYQHQLRLCRQEYAQAKLHVNKK